MDVETMLEYFEMLDGFNEIEKDEIGLFAWCKGVFRMRARRAARYAKVQASYPGTNGTLRIRKSNGELIDAVAMQEGWHPYMVRLDVQPGDELICEIDPVIQHPIDTRELGMMLRAVELFEDDSRCGAMARTERNFRLNLREYHEGVVAPKSFPPLLRVTTEVRCNLPETGQACVYCGWDKAKRDERGSPGFVLDTLEELGDFYRCATEVVDCSIGEPTMKKDFPQIVSRINDDGKQMSITTNGQLLVERRRQQLLGKSMSLYISIDSATAEGYSRYRNDRFDDIIRNLRALCREKKAHNDLPRVFVTFLTMRSNVAELPQYLDLMKDVGVDIVKLRSLMVDDIELRATVVNNGYTFEYEKEVLTIPELKTLAPIVEELARERGVVLYNETEEFAAQSDAGSDPICSEPWRTMYALNRGITPCCYGAPLFHWGQRGERTVSQFLQDCFNSPEMRDIRENLARGELAGYCRNTSSCPIVKKMKIEGQIPDNSLIVPGRQGVTMPMVSIEALRATAGPATQQVTSDSRAA